METVKSCFRAVSLRKVGFSIDANDGSQPILSYFRNSLNPVAVLKTPGRVTCVDETHWYVAMSSYIAT